MLSACGCAATCRSDLSVRRVRFFGNHLRDGRCRESGDGTARQSCLASRLCRIVSRLVQRRTAAGRASRGLGRVDPVIFQIGLDDALRDFDRVLEDMDDVYIGLPTAVWLIYRELRRHRVLVSLDGHGADELMGGYLQAGATASFQLRNLLSAMVSRWRFLGRTVDLARAALIKRNGQFFLRGGLLALPRPFPVVGDDDRLPRQWGYFNRRLYRMLHGTVLPTILRNFDRLSMAHGIEVRMPFLDWRLVTYTVALPEHSKYADGIPN